MSGFFSAALCVRVRAFKCRTTGLIVSHNATFFTFYCWLVAFLCFTSQWQFILLHFMIFFWKMSLFYMYCVTSPFHSITFIHRLVFTVAERYSIFVLFYLFFLNYYFFHFFLAFLPKMESFIFEFQEISENKTDSKNYFGECVNTKSRKLFNILCLEI